MNVALYYPWIYLTSGAERTIVEVTGHSRHDWTIFTNRFERANTFPELSNRRVVELSEVPVRRTPWAVARAALRVLTQRLPLDGFDALVILGEGLGDFTVFRTPRIPIVCYCLTPLRIVFDPVYRTRYLQERSSLDRLAVRLGSPVFRAIDRLAWRRYNHVYCVSEEVRRRILAGRLAGEDKLSVAHVGLGFDPPTPSGRFEPFFLLPGRIMWTKNIELGIEAFRRFRAASPDGQRFRLVVAGIVDDKSRPYLARLRELAGEDGGVEFRIFPSDEELHDLYDTCHAVLFTAFNEDWGIVPLEAMAFGKPVVATDRGGPRESVQHGVQGFLAEPEPDAFARRMAELARDTQMAQSMGTAGRERAREFTWDRLAETIDRKLEELVVNRTGAPLGQEPGDNHATVSLRDR
ncbi:MAG: glycosyltransferase family 4 protein [Phycisphaerae bacterium]|jgi:glycosyltransferase involved in cell wall biosynthesis